MQVEFFFIYLVIIGETEMFGKNACVVVLFNDDQMSKSCDCEECV